GPPRDVTHGTVEEGAEPPGSIGPRPIKQAAVPKAFDEDFLDGVVELWEQLRAPPPRGQVGPHHRRVPGREFGPRRLASRSGVPEQGPAGGIFSPHARPITSGQWPVGSRWPTRSYSREMVAPLYCDCIAIHAQMSCHRLRAPSRQFTRLSCAV